MMERERERVIKERRSAEERMGVKEELKKRCGTF